MSGKRISEWAASFLVSVLMCAGTLRRIASYELVGKLGNRDKGER